MGQVVVQILVRLLVQIMVLLVVHAPTAPQYPSESAA
jgi:hypothetical protein